MYTSYVNKLKPKTLELKLCNTRLYKNIRVFLGSKANLFTFKIKEYIEHYMLAIASLQDTKLIK